MKNLNKENWIEINAKGRTLGRLATEISVFSLGLCLASKKNNHAR